MEGRGGGGEGTLYEGREAGREVATADAQELADHQVDVLHGQPGGLVALGEVCKSNEASLESSKGGRP